MELSCFKILKRREKQLLKQLFKEAEKLGLTESFWVIAQCDGCFHLLFFTTYPVLFDHTLSHEPILWHITTEIAFFHTEVRDQGQSQETTPLSFENCLGFTEIKPEPVLASFQSVTSII